MPVNTLCPPPAQRAAASGWTAETECGTTKGGSIMGNLTTWQRGMVVIAAAAAMAGASPAFAQANDQFIPVLVYRTGAYAPNGTPWANGFVDYLNLVNERDKGINGVRITYEECETGYATDRGVECYE